MHKINSKNMNNIYNIMQNQMMQINNLWKN